MAINGGGFFVVQKPSNFADNRPVFDGIDRYTRRGDFQTDKNGYLVNGAGYYLMGIPVDATTGNLTGTDRRGMSGSAVGAPMKSLIAAAMRIAVVRSELRSESRTWLRRFSANSTSRSMIAPLAMRRRSGRRA